jgi:hypothetical protein
MAAQGEDREKTTYGHSGYALYGVVRGELYVAASRAMVVYGREMDADRFAKMAREIYEEAELDAKRLADESEFKVAT